MLEKCSYTYHQKFNISSWVCLLCYHYILKTVLFQNSLFDSIFSADNAFQVMIRNILQFQAIWGECGWMLTFVEARGQNNSRGRTTTGCSGVITPFTLKKP